MKRYFCFCSLAFAGLALFFGAAPAQGQTYYINAAATGSKSGADWNNAYTSFPITYVRGATYYVGTGSYGTVYFGNQDTSTNIVTVKKAILSDHGTSTGWQDSFTNQALLTSLQIADGYFVFDGQTGGGPGAWTNNFGFKIQMSTTAIVPAVHTWGDDGWEDGWNGIGSGSYYSPYVTIRHIEVQGAGQNSDQGIGFGVVLGNDNDHNTLSYAWIHDTEINPMVPQGNNDVLEYVYTGNYWPQYWASQNGTEHGEVMWARTGTQVNSFIKNLTVRNCVITAVISTGGFILTVEGGNIYGNVFAEIPTLPQSNPWYFAGNGVIGTQNPGYYTENINIFNNTFINCQDGSYNGPILAFVDTYFNPDFVYSTNNLFYGPKITDIGYEGVTAADYDYYVSIGAQSATWPLPSESHGVTNNTIANPFVNYPGLNFNLTANTPPGFNLGPPFNIDPNGNVRTTWTRGAYEFVGGASTNPVLQISVSSGTQVSFVATATNGFVTNTITVWNSGGGTLAGTATLGSPANGFSIISGAAYSLGANQTQTVVIVYQATSASNQTQTVTFTGGGGASASLSGSLTIARPTAPAISLVGVSSVTSNSATIVWTTDQSSSSTVQYGLTTGYNLAMSNPNLVTQHQITLANLTPGTTYHYSVESTNSSGLGSQSGDFTCASLGSGVLAGSGMVGYWDFNVAGSASDASGYGNNGTPMNQPTWVRGILGDALQLDGTNSYASVASSPSLSIAGALSISAWVRLNANGGWQSIAEKLVAPGANNYPFCDYGLSAVDSGSGSFYGQMSVTTTGGTFNYVESSTALSYGAWHQLIGVYDGASSLNIYVDGALGGTLAVSGGVQTSGQPLYLGRNGAGGDSLSGDLDEVLIYNTALTPTAVQNSYLRLITPPTNVTASASP